MLCCWLSCPLPYHPQTLALSQRLSSTKGDLLASHARRPLEVPVSKSGAKAADTLVAVLLSDDAFNHYTLMVPPPAECFAYEYISSNFL